MKRYIRLTALLLAALLLVGCTATVTSEEKTTEAAGTPADSAGETPETTTKEEETMTPEEEKGPRSFALSEKELLDKLEGGWIGQMAGVAWGAPTEFCYAGRLIPLSNVPQWTNDMINDAFGQDDLYVEIPFLDTMKKKGVDCDPKHIAAAFKTTQFALWHANGMARQNLKDGLDYPDSGSYLYNYHADDIDWQIECDFLGMLYPGMVNEAAQRAFELGHIMNYGDGVYGGVFISAMHSAAFTAESIEEIVEAGIAVIPEGTQFRALVDDVMAAYKNGASFENNWGMLQSKWAHGDLCPELPGESNIDAKLNSGYVMLGLLYGKGDMDQTIILSMRCGQDSDCNPSSAASILGNYLGAAKLDDKFKSELDRKKTKFAYTQYSYEGAVQLNYTLMEKQLEKAGAKKQNGVWSYEQESKYKPAPFEQWPDGVYVYFRASASGSKVTFGEVTPYNKNEEILGFTIEMGDGRVFYDVIPVSYTYEKAGTYEIKVTVNGANGGKSEKTKTVEVKENGKAEDTVIICSVTAPAGGGSRNAELIRDGVIPKKGDPDSKQYDTYTLGDPSGNPDKTAYIGYAYKTPKTVSQVVFTEGNHFGNGGWFKDGSLKVQVLQEGVWNDAEVEISPAYPKANDMGAFGAPYETFTLTLKTPQACDGVRLFGTAGGSAGFISVAELDVK